jgi:primosomal protein N' (replication factor Y)
MSKKLIIQVAVPSPLRRYFDYLPGKFTSTQLRVGLRVKVPFGHKKLVGFIVGQTDHSDLPASKLKAISEVCDNESLFVGHLFELLRWAAAYYQYPLGEVLQQALPVLLRQGQAAKLREHSVWFLTELGERIERDELKRAPKQWQAILSLREYLAKHDKPSGIISAELNLLGISRVCLKILEKKELVIERKVSYINQLNYLTINGPILNPEQQIAIEQILSAANSFKTFLLQGITGSGKTEVYLSVLEKLVVNGGQALVLVPEIGLTPQTVARFRERLHCQVAVLHSALSDAERLESWLLAKSGEVAVIIGTRSAIFTPFKNLQCIIVDESHDASFKQWDGFKYHARDVAIRRAQLENIPVVLGSATPSLASLHNVSEKKFQLLSLTERATGASMPKFHIVDIRRQKLHEGIADTVLQKVSQHINAGNQVLVFINRRGFAPMVLCHECGWIADCDRCHVPLTKHSSPPSLQCHHCAKQKPLLKRCESCASEQLVDVGLGTERVEKILAKKFPKIKIARIDRDSTRKRGALQEKLTAVQQGHAQIMIGTQMLAKGHHFPNVTLVIMLGIDSGLYSADFNATEQMAQLVLQVAGRAGREEKPGEVILQTHHPEHLLLQTLVNDGYTVFAEQVLMERQQAALPPFFHMALFRVEAVKTDLCAQFLSEVNQLLLAEQTALNLPTISMFGPLSAPIEKRAGRFRWQLLLVTNHRMALQALLRECLSKVEGLKSAHKVRWSVDIDPINIL